MKDWIIVISSEKGYRLLSYVCPQRNIIHLTVKFFFQILWGINVKGTHNCSSGPRLKKKEKKRECNGLTGRQKSLSWPDFSFRSSLKHRHTDPWNFQLSFEIHRLPRTEKGASKTEFLFQVSGYWYRPDTGTTILTTILRSNLTYYESENFSDSSFHDIFESENHRGFVG